MWLSNLMKIPQSENDKRLMSLALLERASAGLLIDSLSVNPELPLAGYLTEETRKQVVSLIESLGL
jgi:hypothetical protein